MPKRKGDTDNATRRRPSDQVEIRPNREIEVLFDFREERRRKCATNTPSVNAQEAVFLVGSFVFPYQYFLLISAQAGSAPGL